MSTINTSHYQQLLNNNQDTNVRNIQKLQTVKNLEELIKFKITQKQDNDQSQINESYKNLEAPSSSNQHFPQITKRAYYYSQGRRRNNLQSKTENVRSQLEVSQEQEAQSNEDPVKFLRDYFQKQRNVQKRVPLHHNYIMNKYLSLRQQKNRKIQESLLQSQTKKEENITFNTESIQSEQIVQQDKKEEENNCEAIDQKQSFDSLNFIDFQKKKDQLKQLFLDDVIEQDQYMNYDCSTQIHNNSQLQGNYTQLEQDQSEISIDQEFQSEIEDYNNYQNRSYIDEKQKKIQSILNNQFIRPININYLTNIQEIRSVGYENFTRNLRNNSSYQSSQLESRKGNYSKKSGKTTSNNIRSNLNIYRESIFKSKRDDQQVNITDTQSKQSNQNMATFRSFGKRAQSQLCQHKEKDESKQDQETSQNYLDNDSFDINEKQTQLNLDIPDNLSSSDGQQVDQNNLCSNNKRVVLQNQSQTNFISSRAETQQNYSVPVIREIKLTKANKGKFEKDFNYDSQTLNSQEQDRSLETTTIKKGNAMFINKKESTQSNSEFLKYQDYYAQQQQQVIGPHLQFQDKDQERKVPKFQRRVSKFIKSKNQENQNEPQQEKPNETQSTFHQQFLEVSQQTQKAWSPRRFKKFPRFTLFLNRDDEDKEYYQENSICLNKNFMNFLLDPSHTNYDPLIASQGNNNNENDSYDQALRIYSTANNEYYSVDPFDKVLLSKGIDNQILTSFRTLARSNNIISDTMKVVHRNFQPTNSQNSYLNKIKQRHSLLPIKEEFVQESVSFNDIEQQIPQQREQNNLPQSNNAQNSKQTDKNNNKVTMVFDTRKSQSVSKKESSQHIITTQLPLINNQQPTQNSFYEYTNQSQFRDPKIISINQQSQRFNSVDNIKTNNETIMKIERIKTNKEQKEKQEYLMQKIDPQDMFGLMRIRRNSDDNLLSLYYQEMLLQVMSKNNQSLEGFLQIKSQNLKKKGLGGGFQTFNMNNKKQDQNRMKEQNITVQDDQSKKEFAYKIINPSSNKLKNMIDDLYNKEKKYVRQYIREDFLEANDFIFNLQKSHQLGTNKLIKESNLNKNINALQDISISQKRQTQQES